MVVLDLFILLFVCLAVLRGARTGFLAGVFSLVGVVVGAWVGSRIAQSLAPDDGGNPIYGLGITLICIAVFAVFGEILARVVGGSLRNRLTGPASSALDGIGGGALGLALSLVLVWAVGVFALQSPPLTGLHPVVEQSRILGSLNERMPAGMLTRAVAEIDPLPEIRGPDPDVAPPEKGIVSDPDVEAAAARTVRVTGVACGYGVEGSGWVASRNLVVTNAHVVAGETVTRVQPQGVGRSLRARVVLFDEKNDVAILRVRRLGLSPLPLAQPRMGESAAVIGFPQNGPLDVRPARTGETKRVISGDAYNEGPVERVVTGFRVLVRPGNSGGPAVNADGEVVSTIFASRADSSNAGFGIPSRLIQQHLQVAAERTAPVSTGGCAN